MGNKNQQRDSIHINIDCHLRGLFYILFQLIPIWIMGLLHVVSGRQVEFNEFISTLLVFNIATCATIIPDIGRNQQKLYLTSLVFLLLLILCFSSVLYCLLLVDESLNQRFLMFASIAFTIIVACANLVLQYLGEQSKREE